MPEENSEMLVLGPVIAERTFTLFKRDGTPVSVSVRLGKPFIGTASSSPEYAEYRCALQIIGIGNERVTAPWGEDQFVAVQYAIDLIGLKLDDLVRRENLEVRYRTGEGQTSWIKRYPPH